MITIDQIKTTVSNYFHKSFEELESNRKPGNMIPRQIAVYLSKTITGKSPVLIVRHFNIDDTTVYNSVKRIDGLIKSDIEIRRQVDELMRMLKNEN